LSELRTPSSLDIDDFFQKNNFACRLGYSKVPWKKRALKANNESSEVCGIIKTGRRVKLNSSQAVNVHKLLTIRYLRPEGYNDHTETVPSLFLQYEMRIK